MTCRILSLAMPLAALSVAISPAQTAPRTVGVATKPGGRWVDRPVRTLDDLPGAAGIRPDAGLSRYGGLAARKEKATGFFRTAKIRGRWWLVDPEDPLSGDRYRSGDLVAAQATGRALATDRNLEPRPPPALRRRITNMHDSTHDWALILAAGEGSRLRSLTTRNGIAVPKQFCSLNGGASLLQDALHRAESVAPRTRIATIVAQQHRR